MLSDKVTIGTYRLHASYYNVIKSHDGSTHSNITGFGLKQLALVS